jgi:hypothetical protein
MHGKAPAPCPSLAGTLYHSLPTRVSQKCCGDFSRIRRTLVPGGRRGWRTPAQSRSPCLQLHSPKIHFRRDEFDAVFPALYAFLALPDHHGRVRSRICAVQDLQLLFKRKIRWDHREAPVGPHHTCMRVQQILAAVPLPSDAQRHARIYAHAAALRMNFSVLRNFTG